MFAQSLVTFAKAAMAVFDRGFETSPGAFND
jgi:hypothetical protein